LYNSIGWDTLFNSINDPSKNAIVSPLAIMGSVFMLAESADDVSKQEIYDVFSANLDEGVEPLNAYHEVFEGVNKEQWNKFYNLTVANGIFYHDATEMSDELRQNSLEKFGATLQGLNFAGDAAGATETINKWASDTTNGMISPLYPQPLKETTAMVLASSIYFKSNWQDAFELEKDVEDLCWNVDLNLESDNCLEGVQFMSVEKDMYYANDRQAKAEIIEIPFSYKPNR